MYVCMYVCIFLIYVCMYECMHVYILGIDQRSAFLAAHIQHLPQQQWSPRWPPVQAGARVGRLGGPEVLRPPAQPNQPTPGAYMII